MMTEPRIALRRLARHAWYRLVPTQVAQSIASSDEPAAHETARYWNSELSGRMSEPNRNGRLSNALRDATTAVLLDECAPSVRRVLDVGCGFGDLVHVLEPRGTTLYHGVDLSDFVIARASEASSHWPIRDHGTVAFFEGDLRSWTPPTEQQYDVVVFNEVLKYVSVDESIAALRRFRTMLAPGGVISVNISADPKSQAIFRALERHFEWIYGTVYQQRPERAVHRLTHNPATPPFLVGVFGPERAVA